MILFFHLSRLYMYPENRAEAALLMNPATASRLAFIPAEKVPENVETWRLHSSSSPFMDWKKRCAGLPAESAGAGLNPYWIRVFADHIAVKLGLLPLHCAVIKYGRKVIFLFAPSGGGKSQLACTLTSSRSSCSLICDDHCVIEGKSIFGNSLLRLRTSGEDIFIKTRSSAVYIPEMAYGLHLGRGENNFQSESGRDFSTPAFYYEALKYIEEEPRSYPVRLADIFGESVKTRAEMRLRAFLDLLKGCWGGSGSLSFLNEKIFRYMLCS